VGGIAWQSGQRVYLDANLFIYAVEQISPFASHVETLFQAADQGQIVLVTSLLTLAETLVMPYRQTDHILAMTYRELFTLSPPGLYVTPLSAQILDRAARLRAATSSLRLPDAIHLATALAEQCDLVVTNDRRLRTTGGIDVIVLSEIG
jgi:predicted nucleic acid-binding protein